MSLRKHFSKDNGWNKTSRNSLIQRLLEFLYDSSFDGKIYGVCCTVNMEDHDRAINDGYPLKPAIELCTAFCCERVMAFRFRDIVDLPASQILPVHSYDFFFDDNEPYLHRLKTMHKQWRNSSIATWGLIHQISPVSMKQQPAVQLADMLAWSKNRSIEVGVYTDLCKAMLSATGSSEWNLDYSSLIRPHRRRVSL